MADYPAPATPPVGGRHRAQRGASPYRPLTGRRRLRSRARTDGAWQVAPVALAAAAALLSACVGDVPEVDAGDAVLVEGRQLYINNCIGCHGADGGGGTGPKLSDGMAEANYPNIAEQIRFVAEGKGRMPAFEARLTAEELEAVTRYTREGL